MTSPLLRAAHAHLQASEPPPSSRLRRFGKAVRAPLIFVALASVGVLVAGQLEETEADVAQVGDCMHDRGVSSRPDLQIVGCSKTDAQYKVAKVIRDSARDGSCEAEGPEVFGSWTQKRSTSVVILCLALNTARPGGPVPLPNWPMDYQQPWSN
ncbi:hypothetical protein ACFWXO_40905 [Kitasatospora sp. NPDC059088]|uniref:LppU/SCO3897 family protein n=1 Tax=Kitasatospora sp. NPDC059088 TaxID=3346722 RepID=UPI00367C17A9